MKPAKFLVGLSPLQDLIRSLVLMHLLSILDYLIPWKHTPSGFQWYHLYCIQ
jgi:hypothetical protein